MNSEWDRDGRNAKVVDLLKYRESRYKGRQLSLLEDSARPRLSAVWQFRPLNQRDIAHRERMLKFAKEHRAVARMTAPTS